MAGFYLGALAIFQKLFKLVVLALGLVEHYKQALHLSHIVIDAAMEAF